MHARHGIRGWGLCWLLGIGLVFCPLSPSAPVAGQLKDPQPGTKPGNKDKVQTEVIPLDASDAEHVTKSLKAMFAHPAGYAGAFIEFFPHRRLLLIRGSAEQVQEVKDVLRVLGEPEPKGGNTRVINLDKGSASTLAEALAKILGEMRANPVKIIKPGSEPPKKPVPEKKDPAQSKAGPPITLAAFGDKLLVDTEDPQALALVVALARLYQQSMVGCDFEVIRLKYAKAASVAGVLREAFNGPRHAKGEVSQCDRVRVVAEPATNALLLSASPLDVLTVRELITQHLDTAAAEKINK